MRNVLLLVILSIFHHGMAQDLPGTLIGETYLSFQTSFNTVSIAGCEIGQAHLLVVSGTYGVANGSCDRDAAFMNFDNPEPLSGWVWNDICNGCQNNRPTPDAYNVYHVYSFPFEAVSSEQLFHFQDNGGAGDNCGGLSLAIYLLGTPGCTDPTACNFDLEASSDDGSCVPSGCMETEACNYNELAECEGEECDYSCCPGPACCGEGTTWNSLEQTCESIPCETILDPLACGPGTYWDETVSQCLPVITCQEDLDGDGVIGINDLMQLLSSFGTMCEGPETGEFTCGDPMNYHGYDYATVQIGEQCWFAENLRTEFYQNGDSIQQGLSDSDWESTTEGASCVYGEGVTTCSSLCDEDLTLPQFGRLYNGYAAIDSRNICPTNWHVAHDEDWILLEVEIGMSEEAANSNSWRGDEEGFMLKSTEWNGSDDYGFSALPGGGRYDGVFLGSYGVGYFWTPTSSPACCMESREFNAGTTIWRGIRVLENGYSIRCIKD